jgi:hypothetical protein
MATHYYHKIERTVDNVVHPSTHQIVSSASWACDEMCVCEKVPPKNTHKSIITRTCLFFASPTRSPGLYDERVECRYDNSDVRRAPASANSEFSLPVGAARERTHTLHHHRWCRNKKPANCCTSGNHHTIPTPRAAFSLFSSNETSSAKSVHRVGPLFNARTHTTHPHQRSAKNDTGPTGSTTSTTMVVLFYSSGLLLLLLLGHCGRADHLLGSICDQRISSSSNFIIIIHNNKIISSALLSSPLSIL